MYLRAVWSRFVTFYNNKTIYSKKTALLDVASFRLVEVSTDFSAVPFIRATDDKPKCTKSRQRPIATYREKPKLKCLV